MVLFEESSRERRIAATLRERAVEEIEARGGARAVAEELDVISSAIETLLWRQAWSLATAFRVADALGIGITAEIEQVVLRDAHGVASG